MVRPAFLPASRTAPMHRSVSREGLRSPSSGETHVSYSLTHRPQIRIPGRRVSLLNRSLPTSLQLGDSGQGHRCDFCPKSRLRCWPSEWRQRSLTPA